MGECTKTILFIFNFFIFGVGVALVVVASLLLSRHREYGVLLGNGVFTLPLGILLIGVFFVLLGFLACCGAMIEKPCMLYTYASVVLVLVIAEVVLVTLLLVFKDEAEAAIQNVMREVFDQYGREDQALSDALDHAQQELQCCGVLSFSDWANTTYGASVDGVSDGCCRTFVEDCGQGLFLNSAMVIFQTVFTTGCYTTIRNKFSFDSPVFFIVIAVIILIQLVSVSFAFGVAKRAQKMRMSVRPSL